ncbi:MAG: hypothetical protein ABMB14_29750, partial [Myxococcota bacterium]
MFPAPIPVWISLAVADSAASEGDVDAPPPATVLDHRVVATIDAAQQLTETVTWTVRIDDPAACSAGLVAPPGLDGANDDGARVLDDLLVIPPSTPVGATFTLEQTHAATGAAQSGVFQSAPDLPTRHASLVVEVPSTTPLTVWADPSSTPRYDTRRARRVEASWSDVAPGAVAEAAWSTWRSWADAGAIVASVDRKLADKGVLGRTVAGDLEGLGLGGIVDRVLTTVAIDPGPPGEWATARSAAAIADSGHGTAAERGVLLLAMLEIAGIEAEPVYFRSSRAPGTFPITVPAPRLLPHPAVAIRPSRICCAGVFTNLSVKECFGRLLGSSFG